MRKKETNKSAGFGAVGVVLIVVAVALVGLIAWRVYDASKTKSTSSTSQTSSNTGSSQANNQTQAADPYVGWSQYCSTQEKSCFKYPSNWTTKNVGAVDPAGDGIQLTSPSGTIIWFQSTVSGLGGACQPGTPDVYNHKVVAAPHVANLYVVESGTQSAINHIGLENGSNGQAPKTGDTGSCISATTFTSKRDPSVNVWLESNGVNNFKSTDLSTAELILESYTY
jgi:hypothetical protein